MEICLNDFYSTLLKHAGISYHRTTHNIDFVKSHFDEVFENVRLDEVVIVSGNDTFEVNSVEDVLTKWDDLNDSPTGEVRIYRMSKSVWFGIQASFRHQKEKEDELKKTG